VARALKGMVKVGKVDCDKHAALCEKHGVSSYPQLKLFRYRTKTPVEYAGQRTAKPLVAFALKNIPSFVKRVKTERELSAVLKQKPKPELIALFVPFTKQSKPVSPLLKTLSRLFRKHSVTFALFSGGKSGSEADVLRAFGVSDMDADAYVDAAAPLFLVRRADGSGGVRVQRHTGKLKQEPLYNFLATQVKKLKTKKKKSNRY
jgi:hypothetical protein